MMGLSGFDFGYLNRSRWVKCYGTRCQQSKRERRLARLGCVALACMGFALGVALGAAL